jgi:flagellar biosynthetic protein FliO
MLQLLWTLLCVVVIIGLAYWVTKYLVAGGFRQRVGGVRRDDLAVLARLPLGKDQQLVVIQAGSRCFLLGVTATQVTTLAEFTQQEAEAWLAEHDQTPEGQPSGFGQALREALRQKRRR